MENIEKLDTFLENVDKISKYVSCNIFSFLIMFNNGETGLQTLKTSLSFIFTLLAGTF